MQTAFIFLLPANEVCEGYVFTGICLSTGKAVAGPEADTPQADTPLPNACWDTPPADTTGYGQQAGGTHPTGMHSCSPFFLCIMDTARSLLLLHVPIVLYL